MKIQVLVHVERFPGKWERITAHCEAYYDEEMGDDDHRLEFECAVDEAGNYVGVPTGFWHKVESHLWGVWHNKVPDMVRGDTRHYFPQYSEISLPLEEQSSGVRRAS